MCQYLHHISQNVYLVDRSMRTYFGYSIKYLYQAQHIHFCIQVLKLLHLSSSARLLISCTSSVRYCDILLTHHSRRWYWHWRQISRHQGCAELNITKLNATLAGEAQDTGNNSAHKADKKSTFGGKLKGSLYLLEGKCKVLRLYC